MYFVKCGTLTVGSFDDEKDISDWIKRGGAGDRSGDIIAYKVEESFIVETKLEFTPVNKKKTRKVKI
jgi:hypothetical protein